jgi:hypothetical protein
VRTSNRLALLEGGSYDSSEDEEDEFHPLPPNVGTWRCLLALRVVRFFDGGAASQLAAISLPVAAWSFPPSLLVVTSLALLSQTSHPVPSRCLFGANGVILM